MFFKACAFGLLVTWGTIASLVLAVLYAPRWVSAVIGIVVALVLLRPNVRGRSR